MTSALRLIANPAVIAFAVALAGVGGASSWADDAPTANVTRAGPASSGALDPYFVGERPLRVGQTATGGAKSHAIEGGLKPRSIEGGLKPRPVQAASQPRPVQAASQSRSVYDRIDPPRVGSSLTAAEFGRLGCRSETTTVDSVVYHRCGSNWFRRFFNRGEVAYKLVPAPRGH